MSQTPSNEQRSARGAGAWGNVVALGVVSLFTDMSSEMIVPLLPAFLTGVLGAGPLLLGWVEGLAEATASVLKLVAGIWADRSGRRRPFVVVGYVLAAVGRPLVAAATLPWHVVAVRVVDRIGKGLRTSPRDAIIAASVPEGQRGSAFGFHRSMDHVGAVLGPLIALAVLSLWTEDLRTLFWLAALPAAASVIVVAVWVREPATPPRDAEPPEPAQDTAAPNPALARFLVPLGLFTLGNASDLFLLLKAGAVRAPLLSVPMLWLALHVVKAATSLVGGRLSDRWGKRRTVALGWLVYIACYTGFAFAETRGAVYALFVVYGAYHGLSEAGEKSLVAALSPARRGGTGFGWYHLTLGMLSLAASLLFGGLWEAFGDRTAFLVAAALAAAALVALVLLTPGSPGGRARGIPAAETQTDA